MTISGLGVGIGRGASRLWFKQHSLLAVLTPDLMREEGCLGALCFVLVLGFGCGELLCFGVVLWFGLLGGGFVFCRFEGLVCSAGGEMVLKRWGGGGGGWVA